MVINADNGPENSGKRSQWLKRLVEFSAKNETKVQLAYYPPYHSKYNPIERVWGVLEQHWNGSLLDSCETVLRFAKTMMFRGQPPVVRFVSTVYHTGVRLTQTEMARLEQRFQRLPGLAKWFVRIVPVSV